MSADELVAFFNTFGGGGKPIGGAHENFGVGSKTSLMPWNQHGMVVISWVNGDASMIWVTRNPDTGEYGLKLEPCEDRNGEPTLEPVYDPYEDWENHGCDWAAVKPKWITDHGTVIILLGNSATDDTVEGDPNRDEADIKGISSFLNRRFWEIPDGVEVYVDELRGKDKASWPLNEMMARRTTGEKPSERRTNYRKIEGARHYINYETDRFSRGKIGAQGTVALRDGTEIDWFLWDGERPAVQSYAAIGGYIAACYKNELYDVTSHQSTYRSFGVSEAAVRTNLWLIVRPVVDPDGKKGVYPKGDRNSLLILGGKNAGESLPINQWAGEFADEMPEELKQALREARQGNVGTLDDDGWREKLAERFGARWRIARLRLRQGGALSMSPSMNGTPPRKSKRTVVDREKVQRERAVSSDANRAQATKQTTMRFGKSGEGANGEHATVDGGVPSYRAVKAGSVGAGIMAAWQPNDPECPEGVVLINVEHPILRSVIEYWQSQYPDHYAEEVEHDVVNVYGQVAVSKLAHSEHLKGILPTDVIEGELRSDAAMTMSLLGLIAEDQLIATRLGGKYAKRRLAVADKRGAQRPMQPR